MYFCLKYEKCCKYLGDNRHEGSSYFAIVLQSVFINDKYLTLVKKKHTLTDSNKISLNQEVHFNIDRVTSTLYKTETQWQEAENDFIN